MSEVEKRIQELGLELPEVPEPRGVYVLTRQVGNLVFQSGQVLWKDNKVVFPGKLGETYTVEEGSHAAAMTALRCISVLKTAADLDRIKIIKVLGFINSVPDFTQQPQVLNGASRIFEAAFGENGKHARTAIGVAALPGNAAVEIELVAQIIDDE